MTDNLYHKSRETHNLAPETQELPAETYKLTRDQQIRMAALNIAAFFSRNSESPPIQKIINECEHYIRTGELPK